MTRRTSVSPRLLAGFFGLMAACLPSLLAESGFGQLGGIAPNPELDEGYSRRALRSTPPVPPLGSTTTISFQIQFDGLTLPDSALEDFKAAYCADLVSATREESSFCHVAKITPSQPSGLLVATGLYYPEPVPPTAINPDTLAAAFVVSPAFLFSPGFKEAYGNPTRGENVVVNSVYAPPPPDIPPEPPSPAPPPASPAPGNSGTNGATNSSPPIRWWDISPPPPLSPKRPSFPPQPPSPGVPAQLPPSPLSPWSLATRPSPPSPPAPPTPRVPPASTAPALPFPSETRPPPPAPSTPGEPPDPTAPEIPADGAGGPDGAARSPPAPSRPGSPSSGGLDRVGCMQMAEIESLLASQIQQLKKISLTGKCELGCLLEHFPTTSITAPVLRCAFNTVKCLDARRTGIAAESEFLGAILRLLSCITGETSGNGGSQGNSGNSGSQGNSGSIGSQVLWDSGTIIPFIEATQAVIESPSAGDSTPEILCDAMMSLRLVSEIQLKAILDVIELKDSSVAMLDTVGVALEKFAPRQSGSSLAGYSDPVTGDSDGTHCGHFPWSLNRIFDMISEAFLDGLLDAGETEDIGPKSVRLKLMLQDIPDNSQGLKFSFPDLDGGNRKKRHRSFAPAEAPAPIPEIDMPVSFAEACIATPLACPLPLPISLSYIADSTYLMCGLGTAIFVSAAADSANVSTAGLMVAPVSGTIGIRLPFGSGMVLPSVLLHFPLDGQVPGALGKDGKLCVRIDYDLMLPVVVGPPHVASGVATCAAAEAGDYLVVQLAYALANTKTSSSSTYIPTRGVQLSEPIYGTYPKAPSRRMWMLWMLLYACMFMLAAALCIMVGMWLRRGLRSSEDEDAWMYEGEEEEEDRLLSPWTLDQVVGGGTSAQLTNPSSPVVPVPAAAKHICWLNDDASPPIATPEGPSRKKFRRVPQAESMPVLKAGSTTEGPSRREAFKAWGSFLPSAPSLPRDSRDPAPGGPSRDALRRWGSRLPIWKAPSIPRNSRDPTPEGPSREALFRRLSLHLPSLPRGLPDSLYLETANGEEQIVQKIVKMHFQGRRDRTGRTALHLAIAKRNLAAVQALTRPLGKHQSPLDDSSIFSDGSMQDSSMRNPLHTAAETGELEIFQHLLTLAGSNVQQAVSLRDVGGNTVLHLAAHKGHSDIIDALQEIPGCDLEIDAQNRGGWTALQLAASRGDLEMVVQLLKSNPDIDLTAGKEPRGVKDIVSSSRTALHIASMLGRRDVVKALLRHMHKVLSSRHALEQGIE